MQGDYDVVVVGAGNAAMVAALSAREAGARVLVLEKAPQALRGGDTYFAGGAFRFPHKGNAELMEIVPDLSDAEFKSIEMPSYSADQFYNTWMRLTEGLGDPVLAETVVGKSNDTVHWMVKQGVKWEPYMSQVVRVDGRLKWLPGDAPIAGKGGGAGLSEQYFELIPKKGIDLKYETKAVELLADSRGRIVGVKIKDNEEVRDIRCKGVVLGCGGFQANRQMRCQHLGKLWEMARIRGTRYNMGDGIRMALAVGAQPCGHWSGCHGTQIDANAPYLADRTMTNRTERGSYHLGIMVNADGDRFVDEGEDIRTQTYAKYGQAVLNQPGGVAFQIFDSKTKDLLVARYETGNCTRTNSIEELADGLGIDTERLTRTVKEYNASVQEGPFNAVKKDGKHTVGIKPPKSNWALKVDTPPFSAYAVTGGVTFTYGGIKINQNAQVLDTEDRVIPGLYATGEIVGGLFYYNYPGGTGLMAGAVFGRLAGNAAANQ
ncbi:MAG: FAD-dependent tricarballylate dehydrogenase TcuA [Chloroflexi bacterium]|nr:FAD-dependent tricarballylate dehydrogenase TcuA [Chloroflexota bacterium]